MQGCRVYFPGLNGLRFLAASLIIIHHVEQFKSIFGFRNYWDSPSVSFLGRSGVTLFFVLSGFLITYLLFAEKKGFGNIALRKFYIRRFLRICPLYFLIVLLALFVIPRFHFLSIPELNKEIGHYFGLKVFLFFTMLPNIALILFAPLPYASHTWVIGVEGQFYLIWPLIVKYTKKYMPVFFIIIILQIAVSNGLAFISHLYKGALITHYFSMFRISCMAIGGIGAFILFFNKEKVFKVIFRRDVQILVMLTTMVFLFKGIDLPFINDEFYAALFCILILNISSNKSSIVKLENKVFDFLGRISYGLFIYHPLMIAISIVILKTAFNNVSGNPTFNFLLYALSFLLTALLAVISYYLFEARFLKTKLKFSRITSGSQDEPRCN